MHYWKAHQYGWERVWCRIQQKPEQTQGLQCHFTASVTSRHSHQAEKEEQVVVLQRQGVLPLLPQHRPTSARPGLRQPSQVTVQGWNKTKGTVSNPGCLPAAVVVSTGVCRSVSYIFSHVCTQRLSAPKDPSGIFAGALVTILDWES